MSLTVESLLHAARDSIALDPRDIFLRERMRRNGGTELWLVRWPGVAGAQADVGPPSSGPHPLR